MSEDRPRRGRPPRADTAATTRVEIRATEAERDAWAAKAGEQPLSEWIRMRLNRAR